MRATSRHTAQAAKPGVQPLCTGLSRRQRVVPRAQQNKAADDLAKQAQEFARRTSKSVSDFVREQKLDKKAAAVYEDASQQLRTNYMKLDAEWDIAGRVNNLQGRLNETAQDIDQQFNVRRKVRAVVEDTRRMAPIWRRRAAEYASTTQGKAALTLLLVGLLLSGTLFKLLNLIWLGWWVSVPVSLFLADQERRRRMEGQRQARENFSSSKRSEGGNWDRTGPVVEAEWVSLDDDRRKL